MDEFISWVVTELQVESLNSKSHDFAKRKSANARYELLQHGLRLLNEYAQRFDNKSPIAVSGER